MKHSQKQSIPTTGIDLIDNFQSQLLGYIESLRQATGTNDSQGVLEQMVSTLSKDYPDFYRKVDNLLKRIQFPQKQEHAKLQQELAKKLVELKTAVKQKQKVPSLGLVGYLRDWSDRYCENNQQLKKFLLYNKDKIDEIKNQSAHSSEFLTWEDTYNVGHDVIDAQHRKIVEFINRLNSIGCSSDQYKLIYDIFKDLVAYTQVHFHTEEQLMREHGYTESAEHKEKHLSFVKQITRFMKDFKEEKKNVTGDLLVLLKSWLLEHIQQEDKKLARFIQEKTKQPV